MRSTLHTADQLVQIASELTMLGQYDEAESILLEAVHKHTDSDDVWHALIQTIESQNRKLEAFLKTGEWLTCCPHSFNAHLQHLSRSIDFCHWSRYDHDVKFLKTLSAHEGFVLGETALTVPGFSNELLATWVERYSLSLCAIPTKASNKNGNATPIRNGRLRIGFLGQDFHGQATNYLMIGFVEAHDRDRFEFIAYDCGPDDKTDLRRRAVNAYDQFRHLHTASNQEIERTIRADNLDILFFMQSVANHRLPVLASRPAPIQLAYLYYPGPFNFGFMDGMVADDFVIPEQHASSYRCPIWRLPGCYQPNDANRYIPSQISKAHLGLSEKTFVFANFNSPHKINPFTLDLWAEVLKHTPSAVMMLLGAGSIVEENLRLEFRLRGVEDQRLMFSSHLPSSAHLERLTVPDLILDSFPYGGHTLTSDALWAGTPVLTLCGETFSSRVAGSLLRAVSLNELVTNSPQDYIQRAVDVYRNEAWLTRCKANLKANRHGFDLFNPAQYARQFESMLLELINMHA